MLTVFSYAKLWRRPGALTDINFYELRYSGRPAAFLRGFRAIYLGVFFNIMIMATVTLAAIKIAGVLLGLDPLHDGRARGADHHGLLHHGGPVGRGGDRLLPVCSGDDRLIRRRLLRGLAAERRRLERLDVQSWPPGARVLAWCRGYQRRRKQRQHRRLVPRLVLGCLFVYATLFAPAICSMAVPRSAFPAPQSPWLRLLASGELYPKLAFGQLEPPL
jgi:hypothetical protein